MLQNIYMQSIPSQLFQSDYVCMYFSIENRSPYLDSTLVEFAYTLPTKLLIKNGYNKDNKSKAKLIIGCVPLSCTETHLISIPRKI